MFSDLFICCLLLVCGTVVVSSISSPSSFPSSSPTTLSPSAAPSLPVPSQWIYFTFHQIEAEQASSIITNEHCAKHIIDYVHAVRVDECQTDKVFLQLWNVSSTANAFKPHVSNDDMESNIWLETFNSYEECEAYNASDYTTSSVMVVDASWPLGQCTLYPFQGGTIEQNYGLFYPLVGFQWIVQVNVTTNMTTPRIIPNQVGFKDIYYSKNYFRSQTFIHAGNDRDCTHYDIASNFTEIRAFLCVSYDNMTSFDFSCIRNDGRRRMEYFGTPTCQGYSFLYTQPLQCAADRVSGGTGGGGGGVYFPRSDTLSYQTDDDNDTVTITYDNQIRPIHRDFCHYEPSIYNGYPTVYTTPAPSYPAPTHSPTTRIGMLILVQVKFALVGIVEGLQIDNNDTAIQDNLMIIKQQSAIMVCDLLGKSSIENKEFPCVSDSLHVGSLDMPSTNSLRSTLSTTSTSLVLWITVNVTLNAVDYDMSDNVEYIVGTVQNITQGYSMYHSLSYYRFYLNVFTPITMNNIFNTEAIRDLDINSVSCEYVSVLAKSLISQENIGTSEPSASPTLSPETRSVSLSPEEIVGLSISMSILVIFQIFAVILCFCREDRYDAAVKYCSRCSPFRAIFDCCDSGSGSQYSASSATVVPVGDVVIE